MSEYPKVTPDLEGSRYCSKCLWENRIEPNGSGVLIVRFSPSPFDSVALCESHAKEKGYV